MAAYKSDIEIAQECEMKPIHDVAVAAGIDENLLECYGKYKAKLDITALKNQPMKGKLILVTAINPTPAGEGKTTTSVGLADGLRKIGKNAMLALREPSLGPVFGIKGGAAGGGYERPPAAQYCGRPGRPDAGRAQRGRFRYHCRFRNHGHFLPGNGFDGPEGAPG